MRSGVRVGRSTLVVHAARPSVTAPVRVGFVVSKAVGNAAVRNRVKRRLRHLARERVAAVPSGVSLVVRALPAASSTPKALAADLEQAWSRAVARVAS